MIGSGLWLSPPPEKLREIWIKWLFSASSTNHFNAERIKSSVYDYDYVYEFFEFWNQVGRVNPNPPCSGSRTDTISEAAWDTPPYQNLKQEALSSLVNLNVTVNENYEAVALSPETSLVPSPTA